MKYLGFVITVLTAATMSANAQIVNINVMSPTGENVADIVVYATPTKVSTLPVNPSSLVIDQKDKKFAPYITVMQRGQRINFANQDDITHHIYSVSGENRFEFKLKAGENMVTEQLQAAEEVAMGCNIHDWMTGYALVVDTPFFTKSDKAGIAQLDLPTGEYQITAWHPQLDVVGNREFQKITIDANNNSVTMKLSKVLLPIPSQTGQDEFEFLEEYE